MLVHIHLPGFAANLLTTAVQNSPSSKSVSSSAYWMEVLVFKQGRTEIVLTMLLEKYRFELPREEIVWRNNSMATPTTSRRLHDTPHLPLKVSYI